MLTFILGTIFGATMFCVGCYAYFMYRTKDGKTMLIQGKDSSVWYDSETDEVIERIDRR